MSIGAWIYLPHEYAGSSVFCVIHKHISYQIRSAVICIYFLPPCSFLHKADEIQCLPEQTYFFPRYNSSLELDSKTLSAIHIMQLQFESSGFRVFVLHKHKAETTARVVNVNNLFRVWKQSPFPWSAFIQTFYTRNGYQIPLSDLLGNTCPKILPSPVY